MHKAAIDNMTQILNNIEGEALNVLDVGSLDVNGSYRDMVNAHGWTYTGLDMRKGRNVDIVAEPYSYPIEDGTYDVVISGSTMEHVEAVWLWLPELIRVLKPGGHLVVYTHWKFVEHRYPVDCWRILPDGMRFLFDYCGGLSNYDIAIVNETDIKGVAIKL